MSRPIKFRVWDKENEEMVYHPEMFFDFKTGELTSLRHSEWEGDSEPENWTPAVEGHVDPEEVILMQFTGLHDKNGREVFEGDIVKFYGDDHVRTAEEADRPIQKISWGSRGWNAPQSLETRWEVIGNIWEHPHLLGDK